MTTMFVTLNGSNCIQIVEEAQKQLGWTQHDRLAMEIQADGSALIRPFSAIQAKQKEAEQLVSTLHSLTGWIALIIDKRHVVAIAGVPTRAWKDNRVGSYLQSLILERKTLCGGSGYSLFDEGPLSSVDSVAMAPINDHTGTPVGAVMLIAIIANHVKFGSHDLNMAMLAAAMFGHQLQKE